MGGGGGVMVVMVVMVMGRRVVGGVDGVGRWGSGGVVGWWGGM